MVMYGHQSDVVVYVLGSAHTNEAICVCVYVLLAASSLFGPIIFGRRDSRCIKRSKYVHGEKIGRPGGGGILMCARLTAPAVGCSINWLTRIGEKLPLSLSSLYIHIFITV
jgi:hypothetical protein